MINSPNLSVVIATFNRQQELRMCLAKLGPNTQEIGSENYEVIVSDDGDLPEAIYKEFDWVKFIKGPKKGPAANRNNGASIARGDLIVFTDDDCIPDKKWLLAFRDAGLENPDYKVLEGRIYVDRKRCSLGEFSPVNENGGALWSANFAIERELFNSIGGFDERFPYAAMEDIELHTRLTKYGERILFVRDAAVCHPWRARGGWARCRRHRDSLSIYLSIHPDQRQKHPPILFIRMALKNLINDIIPGLFQYRCRGVVSALLECLSNLVMALRVFGESKRIDLKRSYE